MHEVLFRRVGPANLTVVKGRDIRVKIRIQMDGQNEWWGSAEFPVSMIDDALDRASRVKTPNDLEDLIREFSDAQTWGSYQDFRNLNGF